MTDDEDNRNENQPEGSASIAEELNLDKPDQVLFFAHGKKLSAAGKFMPVAEQQGDMLILYPPNMPLSDERQTEEITTKGDHLGRLLNEDGQPEKVTGAYFRGRPLFRLVETEPETTHSYVGYVGEDGNIHYLFFGEMQLTISLVRKLRLRTVNADLSELKDVISDEDFANEDEG